jgi:hypothetical protein
MAQQTGRVTVKADSVSFMSKAGASIDVGGVNRVGSMTDQGVFIYREENVPSLTKCTIPHMSDTDLLAIRDLKNFTLEFTTDSGVTYTVAGAVITKPPELANGECPLEFMGPPAK